MDIKLSFLGAARNVTGSRYLLEFKGQRILIDCGFFQEWKFKARNWEPFSVPPNTINAVLLTHAHLDHVGLLPKLVREGFDGRVFCTAATAEIATIIMLDAARIQEEDANYKRRRHEREGRKGQPEVLPLYTTEDATQAIPMLAPVPFERRIEVGEGIRAEYLEAGHILGAASIRLTLKDGDEERTVVFSGDIGRPDAPYLRPPKTFDAADYLVMESTYGNREHVDTQDKLDQFERIIHETIDRGGNLIIPSFAVERSQELLYYLHELLDAKRIPPLMVFMDSPMAIRVTQVFRNHPDLFDEEATELLREGKHPCDFGGLKMSRTTTQSKAINQIRGTVIIIAGSGMCTGGRVKHHLVANIERKESTILFVGYQAKGTLGRQILEGEPEVRIHGERHKVKARIEKINGFSGHADRGELLDWIKAFKTKPKRVFITHGEEDVATGFAGNLSGQLGFDAIAPEYQQTIELG
jgi:metallo-beta-lactamase family protein